MKDTKEHILMIAGQLFLQKSFKEVTMQEIVKETGLSKGAFYHYFTGKDELFLEVLNIWNKQIQSIVEQLPAADMDVTDKFWMVNQLAVNFFETSEENPAIYCI